MALGHRFGSKQKIAHWNSFAGGRLLEGGKDTKILYRFFRFVLIGAAHLPLWALHAAGSALGWSIYALSPAYRRNLKANLAQAGIADPAVRREAIASAGKM